MNHHPVVIVGGGFAGVYTAKELLKRNIPVTLISETSHFTFTPLLHEVATGSLSAQDASFGYEGFFRSKKFKFVRGRVTGLDRKKKEVQIGDTAISYQYLVWATGSTTNYYQMEGRENVFVLKTIEDALTLKRAILTRAQDSSRHVSVSVIGGGPTGLELVFDLNQMLKSLKKKQDGADYDLRLIHASNIFCRGVGDKVQEYIASALKQNKIDTLYEVSATSVAVGEVNTTVGSFHSDVTILCAGVRPNTDMLVNILELDPKGHIPVVASLQSVEDPHIFALGDIIAIDQVPVPKLAQTAVREAPVVAENIKRLMMSSSKTVVFKNYKPKVLGMLFSLGFGDGVGIIGPVVVKGVFAWYLWRTTYLFKTPGFGNKLRVAFSWTMNLFQGRNLSEL
ncbi:FAD-dependent oxidoreductase [Candidatus Uhrbacteria bacterium]|nr:FAD-dependent oxidoreductase [Candidatus Uhrbacteria bacterium]